MTCRNAKDDVKTGGSSSFRDQVGGCPEDCPSDIRHGGPAWGRREAGSGSRRERENLSLRCKGRRPSGSNRKDQSTEAGHRGGAARRREEGSVMELDQRGCSVLPRPRANR